MKNYKNLEITFKQQMFVCGKEVAGVHYGENDWDDYEYIGNAIVVKLTGRWVGFYSTDIVAMVEMREDDIFKD